MKVKNNADGSTDYIFSDGAILRVMTDDCAESPREWDNNGVMVCFHKRYKLGDDEKKHGYNERDFSSWDELEAKIREDHEVIVIYPIYLYNHSGLSISAGPFSCQWDSGQVGFIYASRESLKSGGHDVDKLNKEHVEKWLLGEIETYDQFLRGDVYAFIFYDVPCPTCGGKGDVVDSCGGFSGSDPVENGMIDHIDRKYRDELKCSTVKTNG